MIRQFEITSIEEGLKALFIVRGADNDYNVSIKLILDTNVQLGDCILHPEINAESCTCKFGSFYGQSKANKKENKICYHLKECLYLLEYLAYIDTKWRLKWKQNK